MTLFKRLTATTLAAALAFGATAATPARAGGEDVAKVLAGVATLYIISRALRDDDRGHATVSRHSAPTYGTVVPRTDSRSRTDDHRYGTPAPRRDDHRYGTPVPRGNAYGHPRNRQRAISLPGHCADSYRVRGGYADFYGAHCLSRAGIHSLPAACAVEVGGNRGSRTAYSERCLLNNGYQVEARRR